MSPLGTAAQPLRVAIIGAGPAGFYAAERLFKETELVIADFGYRVDRSLRGLTGGGACFPGRRLVNPPPRGAFQLRGILGEPGH